MSSPEPAPFHFLQELFVGLGEHGVHFAGGGALGLNGFESFLGRRDPESGFPAGIQSLNEQLPETISATTNDGKNRYINDKLNSDMEKPDKGDILSVKICSKEAFAASPIPD